MQPFKPLQNILFPTDFSKASEAIIGHVVGLAGAFKAKVWILSVIPSMEDFHGASESYFDPPSDSARVKLEDDRKALEADRLQRLKRLQKERFGPVESEVCVRSGGVAESIVEYASEVKAELIMMPTHGLGRMRRFLIGSVTAKILHDAPCPVWTSPHPLELEPFHPPRHMVLAIDSSALQLDLLIRAVQLAEFFHGKLSVLSAVPVNGAPGNEAVRKSNREVEKELRRQIASHGIDVPFHLMEGNPGDVVRQVAEEVEDADLIVVGHGHMQGPMGRLVTHSYEIIRNAPCPVVTL
jgi:nucleotide-binding universal stress UspA family protein